MTSTKPAYKIREINPNSKSEIELVASYMRQTLVEVLGTDKGTALYSMDWLINRVRWHLDPKNTEGRVFVCENSKGELIAHAIARIDNDSTFGYFSTIFVEPSSRRSGVAKTLMKCIEHWFSEKNLPQIIYNTSTNHAALLSLFLSQGYLVTHTESEMVQLTKTLK